MSHKNSLIALLKNSYNVVNAYNLRLGRFPITRSFHICLTNVSPIRKPELGQTSLVLQDGTTFQELPIAVRNLHGSDLEAVCNEQPELLNCKSVSSKISNDFESVEMVAGFERCYSPRGVFTLLELIPAAEVTPEVAIQALKTIFRLENNKEFRNKIGLVDYEEKSENFTRAAVLSNLVNVILKTEKSHIILDGLMTVALDVSSGKSSSFRDQLYDEVVLRVTEGRFSINQVCDAIRTFAILGKKDCCDKLWPGLLGKSDEIDETNILNVFRVTPHLKYSQRVVSNLAEKKLRIIWHNLNGKDIGEIVDISYSNRCNTYRIIHQVSGWLSTNIHRVNEHDLMFIIEGLCRMNLTDESIVVTLEKFVKMKGLKVSNASLLVSIMKYCKRFRIRSTIIFDGCCEFLLNRRSELSAKQLSAMFIPLGLLDFHPVCEARFWGEIEEELHQRFVEFHPGEALDVMLTCVYLEKYPLNFVKKIFNPYFLDRIHSVQEGSSLDILRSKLKMLDTAMMLECSTYRGPLLPKDFSAKSLWQDGRIRRAANILMTTLRGSVDGMFSQYVFIKRLPLSELYIVDLLLHQKPLETPYLDTMKLGEYTAVLIHIPEHYDSKKQHLIGSQVMRRRHFRRIGLSVIDIDAVTVQKFSTSPEKLRNYFTKLMNEAVLPYSS